MVAGCDMASVLTYAFLALLNGCCAWASPAVFPSKLQSFPHVVRRRGSGVLIVVRGGRSLLLRRVDLSCGIVICYYLVRFGPELRCGRTRCVALR